MRTLCARKGIKRVLIAFGKDDGGRAGRLGGYVHPCEYQTRVSASESVRRAKETKCVPPTRFEALFCRIFHKPRIVLSGKIKVRLLLWRLTLLVNLERILVLMYI